LKNRIFDLKIRISDLKIRILDLKIRISVSIGSELAAGCGSGATICRTATAAAPSAGNLEKPAARRLSGLRCSLYSSYSCVSQPDMFPLAKVFGGSQ